jgi:hypothetical protein
VGWMHDSAAARLGRLNTDVDASVRYWSLDGYECHALTLVGHTLDGGLCEFRWYLSTHLGFLHYFPISPATYSLIYSHFFPLFSFPFALPP